MAYSFLFLISFPLGQSVPVWNLCFGDLVHDMNKTDDSRVFIIVLKLEGGGKDERSRGRIW